MFVYMRKVREGQPTEPNPCVRAGNIVFPAVVRPAISDLDNPSRNQSQSPATNLTIRVPRTPHNTNTALVARFFRFLVSTGLVALLAAPVSARDGWSAPGQSLGTTVRLSQDLVSSGKGRSPSERSDTGPPQLSLVSSSATGATFRLQTSWDTLFTDAVGEPRSFTQTARRLLVASLGLRNVGESVEIPIGTEPVITISGTRMETTRPARLSDAAWDSLAASLPALPADVSVATSRSRRLAQVQANLTTIDRESGELRRYTSMTIRLTFRRVPRPRAVGADNPHLSVVRSVLADGQWFKIPIESEGVYRIDREFLSGVGLSPDGVEPDDMRIYGNGGAPLPAVAGVDRIPDLMENGVVVVGGGDGRMDAGDGVYFYAEGPNGWGLAAARPRRQ